MRAALQVGGILVGGSRRLPRRAYAKPPRWSIGGIGVVTSRQCTQNQHRCVAAGRRLADLSSRARDVSTREVRARLPMPHLLQVGSSRLASRLAGRKFGCDGSERLAIIPRRWDQIRAIWDALGSLDRRAGTRCGMLGAAKFGRTDNPSPIPYWGGLPGWGVGLFPCFAGNTAIFGKNTILNCRITCRVIYFACQPCFLEEIAMPLQKNQRNSGRNAQGRSQQAAGSASTANSTAVPWTFLTNHAHVLIVLHSEPDLVLREVASRVGITERAVQRIVHELEEEGYLTRERIGRRNHYQIISDKHLRHAVESHCTIGEVLELIRSSDVSTKRRTK